MSRTRQHTHHTDSTRARIAKDEANSSRRRTDLRFYVDELEDTLPELEISPNFEDDFDDGDWADQNHAENQAREPEAVAERVLTNDEINQGYELIAVGEDPDYDPNRYDFVWSADYRAVLAIPRKYWDDASYAEYQARDNGDSDNTDPDAAWEAYKIERADRAAEETLF